MVDERRMFGDSAETLAAQMLRRKGMVILARQYRTRLGEIDLIARDGNEIVFVEVKARRGLTYGYPEEAVTSAKIHRISSAGLIYLREKRWEAQPYRVDVIAIEYAFDPPKVTHIVAVG